MIIVYTGNGKGKTSAAVGQAIRAHGQGLRVSFAQFMKRSDQAGEQQALAQLFHERFFAGGRGFFRQEETRTRHREAALSVLAWAQNALGFSDMLILDECLYALGAELLREEELKTMVAAAGKAGVHLVLTGRGLPDWLVEVADIVTEMREIKHAYADGQKATKGIEF